MKLKTICGNCHETVPLPYNEESRPYLADKLGGETFAHRCPECGVTTQKHVNDVRADVDNKYVLIAGAVGLVGAVLLWQYGFIAVLPFLLPVIVYQQLQSGAKAFNRYKLPRF